MYYQFINNLGTSQCIHKNQADIYTPNMNIGCGANLSYPSNIQFVRNNNVRCTGTNSTVSGEVYCDYVTATSLNLV